MKKLIKHAFKNLLKTKVFTILLILIIFVTGLTYTFLETSTNSFNDSFNQVVVDGKLHDYILKTNFSTNNLSSIYIGISPRGDSKYNKPNPLDDEKNLPFKGHNIELDDVKKFATISGNKFFIVLKVIDTKYDFETFKGKEWLVSYEKKVSESDDQGFEGLYKKIKSSVLEKIDLFKIKAREKLGKKYIDTLEDIYKDKIILKETKSISVQSGISAFKVIENDLEKKGINEMVIYDGTSNFIVPQTDNQMLDYISKKAKQLNWEKGSYTINDLKGFKYSAIKSGNGVITETFSVVDPSSYEAIVSPSYANKNSKKAISQKEILNFYSDGAIDFSSDKITRNYQKNIILVDETPFFITGVGTTPDFSFPIIDASHPFPNINSESLVFVNKRGYQRVTDGFRGNPQENYISLKFLNNVSKNEQNQILKEIESSKNSNTIKNRAIPQNKWPNDIKLITKKDDLNDDLVLAPKRVVFLRSIKKTLSTLSYIVTTLMIIFVASIVFFVFLGFINAKRKFLATAISLGYTRFKIAFSLSLVSIVFASLPSAIGYSIGLAIQYSFINLFTANWTLPTYGTPFSLISFLITIIIPFLAIFVLIFLTTFLTLRGNVASMFKEKTSSSPVISKIMKIFKETNVKTRYAMSLMLKNPGKIFLVIITSIITMLSMLTAFSVFGAAKKAYKDTNAITNFEYQVALYSPTIEGGQYTAINRKDLSKIDYVKGAKEIYLVPRDETYIQENNVNTNKPHWHLPSIEDAKKLNDYDYLKNKIQTQALLKYPYDSNVKNVANPWEIVEKLMPDNQLNVSNKNFKSFMQKAFPFYEEDRYNELDSKDVVSKFWKLLDEKSFYPYNITFNTLIKGDTDELYTYIEARTTSNKNVVNYNIVGIDPKTKYVNIDDKYFSAMKTSWNENNNVVPILISKFIAKKLNLQVGSKLNYEILNHVKRNFKSLKNKKIIRKFKVMGILNAYDNWEIYTLKNIANSVLGYPNYEWFNGVFIQDKDSILLNSLPLYSPSGIYFSTDTIFGQWNDRLSQFIDDSSKWKFKNEIASNTEEFLDKYSVNPYTSMFSKINWHKINKYTFENASKLSSNLLYTIQSISISLSILFSIVVISLLSFSNRKKIASLWALGYKKSEISQIFITVFIIPFLIGLFIAIPSAILFLDLMKNFVMNFANILIPFKMSFWSPIVVVAIMFLIYTLSIFISIYKLSNQSAIIAFKGD